MERGKRLSLAAIAKPFAIVYYRRHAPVAQVDRAPASGAGRERSSRSRGAFSTG